MNKKKVAKKPFKRIKYSLELAKEICKVISVTPKGLVPLCKENPHWPCPEEIRKWVREREEFAPMYARAKLDQADVLAEECLEISDNANGDTTTIRKHGEDIEVCNTEWVQRSRLRVDTRKWLASKLAPRIYADKIFRGEDDEKKSHADVNIDNITPDEAYALMQKLLAKFNNNGK